MSKDREMERKDEIHIRERDGTKRCETDIKSLTGRKREREISEKKDREKWKERGLINLTEPLLYRKSERKKKKGQRNRQIVIKKEM